MTRLHLIPALLFCLFGAVSVGAQPSVEKILPMDGHFNADGTALELNWFDALPPRVGSVTVKRRLYGQLGGQSWKVIAEGLGPVMRYTDTTVRPGVAYEYQVLRTARDIVDVGYWLAGTEIPARAQRGHAYVIVDETVADDIAPRLTRFERDLIGDGWRVLRHDVPRHAKKQPVENLKNALALKDWLVARYNEDPFGDHAVILAGHVPILTSGNVGPDGHTITPHATDLFYADMDGRWSLLRAGRALNNQVPSDFIEAQIGRIDFANVSGGNREQEVHLLQAYFDKNHHWRTGLIGDLRTAYSSLKHLTVETYGLRNIVGPQALVKGGHHDVGEERRWLWGVDFGDRQGKLYVEKYNNKAVFALNFGSGKQKFNGRFGPMTAHLAQPWYTLAVGWGARPAWWLHHMALGGTIGDVHMRTVNNGSASKPYRGTMDYYPTGRILWRNPIWVNLLGDPTVRPFVLTPPTQAVARQTDTGTLISWAASTDPDILGYRVYRAQSEHREFEPLTNDTLVDDVQFLDQEGQTGADYMIRAYGLKRVYAGSFYTLSQGAFTRVGQEAISAGSRALTSPANQIVTLPEDFSSVSGGTIFAIVEGPAAGRLIYRAGSWQYIPPTGFVGVVRLRFSVSNALTTDEGLLTLKIGS